MLPFFELLDAIERNNVDDVRAALDNGADPNGRGVGRLSPLKAAEKHHANRVVPLLAKSGADLFDRIGANGDSLLHVAARRENVGFAFALLEAGMTPNLSNALGETPLHIAARTGQTYLAKLLVKHKADVLSTDKKGRTAIAVPFTLPRPEVIRFLEPLIVEADYLRRSRSTYEPLTNQEQALDDVTTSLQLQTVNESHVNQSARIPFSERTNRCSLVVGKRGGRE